ncbi:tRNA pseudouridine(55) synthase TruB [bacterium]|nr:tRNA pseudouridine(55) synthase TruB [bacterium]
MTSKLHTQNGAFNINKPPGLSSQGIVQEVKRLTGLRKIGHAGTLDPIAEGVLPLLCGKATRLFDFLLETRKSYRVTIKFGEATDTMDRTGTVVFSNENDLLTQADFERVLESLIGPIYQEPPMFSARRFKGKRLYTLARQGITVPRQKKIVKIHSFELISWSYPLATFSIQCDRGTYVRVLCDDIGKKTGLGAHLHHLVRDKLGPFELDHAITLDDFTLLCQNDPGNLPLIPMNEIIGFLPALVLSGSELMKISFGNAVQVRPHLSRPTCSVNENELFRVVSAQNELKAVAKIKAGELSLDNGNIHSVFIQPICVF